MPPPGPSFPVQTQSTPPSASSPDIEELHRLSCARKQPFYTDPASGLVVFTSYYLSQRKCCACGCRHCPYRPSPASAPPARMLHRALDDLPDHLDILFWSGGKDSYCALRALQNEAVTHILLLTTYDPHSHIVAHQEVPIEQVARQARSLDLPLLAVPIAYGEYMQCIEKALSRLRDNGVHINRLVFGDLHLRHIRSWRDANFGALGVQLYYPLWHADYTLLLRDLEDAGVVIRISAVDKDVQGMQAVNVGNAFDANFVERLPHGVDAFGENGEFHTLVHVWERPAAQQRS